MKHIHKFLLMPLFLSLSLSGCNAMTSTSIDNSISTTDSTSIDTNEPSVSSSAREFVDHAIVKTIAEIREIESILKKNEKSPQRYLVTAYVNSVTGPTSYILADDLETTSNLIPIIDTKDTLPSLHKKDKATFDVAIRRNGQGVLQLLDCTEVTNIETSLYQITFKGEHGRLSSDKANYEYGQIATITISPEEGYKLSHFTYLDKRVEAFNLHENQYTLTIQEDIDISLFFVEDYTPLEYQDEYALKNYYSGTSYDLSGKTISEGYTSISFEGNSAWYANTEGIRCYPGDTLTFSLTAENCYFLSMELVFSSSSNCPIDEDAYSSGSYTSQPCDGKTFSSTNIFQTWTPTQGEKINQVTLTVKGMKESGDGSRRHNLKNVVMYFTF